MVSLEKFESSWPPLRGSAILRTARQSKGRISQERIAVCAGHVALSLAVHSVKTDTEELTVGENSIPSFADIPVYRLTVLLDSVPDSAPCPSAHQLAHFLRRILELSGNEEDDEVNTSNSYGDLGDGIPELLVIENEDNVVLSAFIELGTTGSARTGRSIVYICLEATGLLHVWAWSGEEGGWAWSYLNRCFLCSTREDPLGERVISAVIGMEPGRAEQGSRYRISWVQEDDGEGVGLGLGLGPQPVEGRRVWSRRITLAQEERTIGGDNDCDKARVHKLPAPKVSVGFSVCLLASPVDALLCGREGVWMVRGGAILFNFFATARLLEVSIPPPLPFSADSVRVEELEGVRSNCVEINNLTIREDIENTGGEHGKGSRGNKEGAEEKHTATGEGLVSVTGEEDEPIFSSLPAQVHHPPVPSVALFAVHDTTEDLIVFRPPGTLYAVSVLRGGLSSRVQCLLKPLPSGGVSSLTVLLNFAILCCQTAAYVYDMCSGQLLGVENIPRCCHCPRTLPPPSVEGDGTGGINQQLICLCRGYDRTLGEGRGIGAQSWVNLWRSCTRGHSVGVMSPQDTLRLRLPDTEKCICSFLSMSGQASSTASLLQYLQDYRRLTGLGKEWGTALLLSALRSVLLTSSSSLQKPGRGAGSDGVGAMDIGAICHALSADPNLAVLPPWLLLAVNGARATDGMGVGAGGGVGVGELGLQKQVVEALRLLHQVRQLMEDSNRGSRQRHGLQGRQKQRGEAAGRGGQGTNSARELALAAAGLDPATALFEDALRRWVTSSVRKLDAGKGGQYYPEVLQLASQDRWMELQSEGKEGLRIDSSSPLDHLSWAFWCEVAETDLPEDLQALFSNKTAEGREGRQVSAGVDPLVLFLSSGPGQGKGELSPMFEVACRALFRFQPQSLPRFVERLGRYRAYMWALHSSSASDTTVSPSSVPVTAVGANDGQNREADEIGIGNSRGDEKSVDTPAVFIVEGASVRRVDEKGHVSVVQDTPDHPHCKSDWETADKEQVTMVEAEAVTGAALSHPIRACVNGEWNEGTAALPSSGVLSGTAAGDGSNSLLFQNQSSTVSSHCARALACLPVAKLDARLPPAHRQARLSLMLGAEMFTEASRLLREEAWGKGRYSGMGAGARAGAGHDQPGEGDEEGGMNQAWAAAMRLLGRLQRAAAAEEKGHNDPRDDLDSAAHPFNEGGNGSHGRGGRPTQASTPPRVPSPYGSLALQHRLAFEDALVESVMADRPDRMNLTMRYRPPGLTPSLVVSMVRRGVAVAASHRSAAAVVVEKSVGAIGSSEVRQWEGQLLCGIPVRTLKRCLLLLLREGDTRRLE
ncbi:unnamed protein product [Choristocarpus tenellus]